MSRGPIDEDPESVTTRWTVDCGPGGLAGKRIGVEGLAVAKTDALLRLELADGRAIDTVLRAREPSLIVPAAEQRTALASRYVALGVEHIMTGYDHLLFVFGLLLLASGTRALVTTITAFTLGHSVTLTLAVLDVARVPSAPGRGLDRLQHLRARRRAGTSPVGGRLDVHPAPAVAHGAAVRAAARTRIRGRSAGGRPSSQSIPLALLCFNVGIELGQLAFVLAILALTAAARPLLVRLPDPARARADLCHGLARRVLDDRALVAARLLMDDGHAPLWIARHRPVH